MLRDGWAMSMKFAYSTRPRKQNQPFAELPQAGNPLVLWPAFVGLGQIRGTTAHSSTIFRLEIGRGRGTRNRQNNKSHRGRLGTPRITLIPAGRRPQKE